MPQATRGGGRHEACYRVRHGARDLHHRARDALVGRARGRAPRARRHPPRRRAHRPAVAHESAVRRRRDRGVARAVRHHLRAHRGARRPPWQGEDPRARRQRRLGERELPQLRRLRDHARVRARSRRAARGRRRRGVARRAHRDHVRRDGVVALPSPHHRRPSPRARRLGGARLRRAPRRAREAHRARARGRHGGELPGTSGGARGKVSAWATSST